MQHPVMSLNLRYLRRLCSTTGSFTMRTHWARESDSAVRQAFDRVHAHGETRAKFTADEKAKRIRKQIRKQIVAGQ
jgi:hypothetical protein